MLPMLNDSQTGVYRYYRFVEYDYFGAILFPNRQWLVKCVARRCVRSRNRRRSQQLKIRRCRLMKNNFNEFVFKRESVEVTFSDIFEMTLSERVEIEVEM